MAYLDPFVLLAVDILDDFRIINIDQIWGDAHNRAMLLMQTLQFEVRGASVCLVEIPEPCPF